jgi:hypothetical protein
MTPKDKAKELVGKFYVNIPLKDCDNRRPHKLALIAVDEILNSHYKLLSGVNTYIYKYWQEVKQEINKL